MLHQAFRISMVLIQNKLNLKLMSKRNSQYWIENYPNLIFCPFPIDLETSSQCQYDNVKIYDGASRQRSKVLGTFCR